MDKCKAKIILKVNGLKLTKQRILLLETILESEGVFSALSLKKKLKNQIDLVTIYRILSLFLNNKIIREVLSNEITKFYELSFEHYQVHPHFICSKCNKIICLSAIDNNDILSLRRYSEDNIIENINIQFSGICSNCK